MAKKITYDDMMDLVKEIERTAIDKTRVTASIRNPIVKEIIQKESEMAINAGVTNMVLTSGIPVTGAMIGALGGAGTGAAASGFIALFGAPAVLSAVGGGAAGAAIGSALPVVGTVIGAAVGAGVTLFVGDRISKKKAQKKRLEYQETIKKQNTYIRDLEKELEELKKKYGEAVEQNARYRHIIAILMAYEDLKKSA